MGNHKVRRLGAVVVGLASIGLVGCGSDDSDAASVTTGATSTTASDTSATSASAPSAPTERPTSMADWEALWAEERAAIVQRIADEGWGTSADDSTLTGPEGLTVDLTACPSGWSGTEGLTDTGIKIGQTIGLSGIYAYPTILDGQRTVFDHYSSEGAFEDSTGKTRTIELITRDDVTDPGRTPALIDELIDSEKVFATITAASANTFRVYGKLNDRCIPHSVISSGHPAWGDPVNHPWTTGFQLSYITESTIWGAFIDAHIDEFPDGTVTVATLALDNDYGAVATGALDAYLKQSEHADRLELVSEKVDLAAPVVTDQMTTLASKDPDFLFVMVGGGQCSTVINEAAQNGMKESVTYKFLPNVCLLAGPTTKEAVGGDGSSADAWWVVNGGGVDLEDPNQFDDAFVAFARELIESAGLDPDAPGDYGSGVGSGWLISQVLQIAGDLPGGLTRSNYLLAERTMDMTNPMLLEGMQLTMNGNADPYLFESGVLQTWDAAGQAWVNQGDPIDLSGRSEPCAWDGSKGVCA
ncbi:MAG: ABC transporter substrate-binding protein [Acidimicrobiia bacterium]|nr:ABC transporter substrate-binding protein [Acidimicrobiia bacterium]